tara:strand:- start:36 stop:2588 length:2553 start_codon:yes stop_codon:yes gene_type:complete
MIEVSPNIQQPTTVNPLGSITHDLRDYQFVTTEDSGAPMEYGVVNLTKDNLEYLTSKFGSSTDRPASFNYYNFHLSSFFPQKINAYNITEMNNNYSLEFTYNYYDVNYETVALGIHESNLPNHYVIKQHNSIFSQPNPSTRISGAPSPYLYANSYGDDINETAVISLATLSGSISSHLYDSGASLGIDTQGFNYAYNSNNYYYQHYQNIQNYVQSEDYTDFKDKTRNCFMSFNRSIENSSAPFYSKLRLNYRARPTNRTQDKVLSNELHGNQHKMRPYMFYFYHHLQNTPSEEKDIGAFSRSYTLDPSNNISSIEAIISKKIKIYPAMTNNTFSQAPESFLSRNEITLFDRVRYTNDNTFDDTFPLLDSIFPNIDMAENSVKRFFSSGFNWSIWKPGLGKFIAGIPDYDPIIVCFKIEKFTGTSNIPTQTFYMDHDIKKTGTNGYSFLEFLDSQLIYGKKYRYKVSAVCRLDTPIVQVKDMFYSDAARNLHSVFINSKISTSSTPGGDLRVEDALVSGFLTNYLGYPVSTIGHQVSGYATVSPGPLAQSSAPAIQGGSMIFGQTQQIENEAIQPNKIYISTEIHTKAEFMEVELFEDSITALEPIFTPPEVKFYNENGKTNDLLVKAQLNYNTYRDEYIPLTPSDSQRIQEYLQYFHPNGTYDFQTINGEGRFELRRLSSPPEAYADFANAHVQTFSNPQPNNTMYSVLAYAVNKIIPNKKYYYILRSINNHGVYSNPTSVFEIELLQDSDDTFIIVNEYVFKNNLTNNYSKSGRRYLQIKVSNLQGLINEQTNEFNNALTADEITNVNLGPSDLENKIWGKTFKIRVTSEKTGKKIDLNVSFKHTDQPN